MRGFVLLLLFASTAAIAIEIPYLSGRVVDQAGLLSPGTRARIEQRLSQLERDTTAQVAVLTLSELGAESIEGFSIRVVDAWKLGTKEGDNGVLFLISRQDRKLRVEVGRGLEGAIPDIYAKRILDDIVVPRFRQGDFEGGITAGVDAIDRLVRKEPVPELKKKKKKAIAIPFPFLMLFVIVWVLSRSSWRRGGFFIGGPGGFGGPYSGGGGSWSGGGGGFSGGGGSFGGGGSSSSW